MLLLSLASLFLVSLVLWLEYHFDGDAADNLVTRLRNNNLHGHAPWRHLIRVRHLD